MGIVKGHGCNKYTVSAPESKEQQKENVVVAVTDAEVTAAVIDHVKTSSGPFSEMEIKCVIIFFN